MMSKQLWGRSNGLIALILLSIPTFLQSMESSTSWREKLHYYLGYPANESPIAENELPLLEEEPKTPSYIKQDNNKTTQYFDTYTKEQLDEAYEQAPPEVKKVLKRLAHPEIKLSDPDIKALFLCGPPGTGKTRTAVMMAYKLKRAFTLVRATKCTEGERGGATVNWRQQFDAMIAPDVNGKIVPTIGIIDEIQEMLDHAGDKHYDTASTSRELGGFLEDQRNNNNFFFVATMNDYQTFADAIKNRMNCKMVIFSNLVSDQGKVDAFKRKITTDKIRLHSTCTDTFLLNVFSQLGECSGRDIRSIANDVIDNCIDSDDIQDVLAIKPEHITKAIERSKKDTSDFSKKEETDAQRQERHFKNNLRAHLIMQTRQKGQKSVSNSDGVNIGVAPGYNIGLSTSITSAPGMKVAQAEKTWAIFYPKEELMEGSRQALCNEEEKEKEEQQAIDEEMYKKTDGYKNLSTAMLDPNNLQAFINAMEQLKKTRGKFIVAKSDRETSCKKYFYNESEKWEEIPESSCSIQ